MEIVGSLVSDSNACGMCWKMHPPKALTLFYKEVRETFVIIQLVPQSPFEGILGD